MSGRACSIDGCERTHWARGYCQSHYTRLLRHGDPLAHIPVMVKGTNGTECTVAGCERNPQSLGLCSGHRARFRLTGDVRAEIPLARYRVDEPCSVPGCEARHYGHGYCRLHMRRVLTTGQVDLIPPAPLPVCQVAACDRTSRSAGYCGGHYEAARINGSAPTHRLRVFREQCELDGCERRHYSLGFCLSHYSQRIGRPRRRALEKAALGIVTAEQLNARIAYYGGKCWMCRAPWTCIDHVKPLAAGGCNWPSNLRPACRSCNARKQAAWPFIVPTLAKAS